MGLLPWVSLMLISLSTLAWIQNTKILEQIELTTLDKQNMVSYLDRGFEEASERHTYLFYEKSEAVTPKNEENKNYTLTQRGKKKEFLEEDSLPEYESNEKTGRKQLFRQFHFQELFSGNLNQSPRKEIEIELFTRLLQKKYGIIFSDISKTVNNGENEPFHFIQTLLEEISELHEKFPITRIDHLANIDFQNSCYRYALYRVLKGGLYCTEDEEKMLPELHKIIKLTKKDSTRILCLYLASSEVLETITENWEAVCAIKKEQEELFKKAKTEENRDILSEEFKNRTLQYISPTINLDFIDFTVTKTQPHPKKNQKS